MPSVARPPACSLCQSLGGDHDERSIRLNDRGNHFALPAEAPWGSKPDGVSDQARFPFRYEVLNLGHVTSKHVLEDGVTVKAAAILSDLHDPWPHLFWSGVDRNGVRCLSGINGKQIVTGKGSLSLRWSGAPAQAPVAQTEVVGESGNNQNEQQYESGSLNQFLHGTYLVTKVSPAERVRL